MTTNTHTLSAEERAALIALAFSGGEAAGEDLADVVGDRWPEVDRRLQVLGLVDTVRLPSRRRRYGCGLTEDGWYWCCQELTARPRTDDPLEGALYAVLGAIDGYLESTGLGLAEFVSAAAEDADPDD